MNKSLLHHFTGHSIRIKNMMNKMFLLKKSDSILNKTRLLILCCQDYHPSLRFSNLRKVGTSLICKADVLYCALYTWKSSIDDSANTCL